MRLRPAMPEWRADLVELQIERGWYGEALAEINQAIGGNALLGRLWRLRADVRMRLGQPDAARGGHNTATFTKGFRQHDLLPRLRRTADHLFSRNVRAIQER